MKCPHRVIVFVLMLSIVSAVYSQDNSQTQTEKPNVVLVMADDQGWGQVGYNGHPILKTPNLDAMAASGIRFDRFYAAGPVCSPTRASVLTGRTHNRTGVSTHGANLCLQEKTLPRALQRSGYVTGHFGKWHLNGVRGPGVPILSDDANHPGRYGFDQWLSVTNYFDVNPLMSRNGTFEEFHGDSSEVIVAEALKFMASQKAGDSPFLAVIWYGSPHSPMRAVDEDRKGFHDDILGHHLGEIVGIDRSVGILRKGLRDLGIERNTLLWYCSDNGGLNIDPNAVGNLKGHKGNLFEGGIRVPGIIEWPGYIKPKITDFPASTMDILPTIVDLLGLPKNSQLPVHDGESIAALFRGETPKRKHAIPFRFTKHAALIEGDYKLLSTNQQKDDQWKLYDLKDDSGETKDLSAELPRRFERMKIEAQTMIGSVEASAAGQDYSEGKVLQPPRRAFWYQMPEYQPHLETFIKRPEYSGYEKKMQGASKKEKSKK